ncbi:type II toxin-antitoxin system VapC family toxin [Polymorphobacter sp. PAMC 29334]|uniref:type II toxin-antitoxin system VapC family toxin n=1 Tax=Polymorphobacter sp. PAMC 29334 TaxID=2862331 RepID=UPI001C679C3A|nr:type II toxin-antitoxin system VapC family toxin [Polymorphobacter sp. PAMC 29334]QYE34355.1 type II toxin-antitoxin system VapC family toxin [Polymorphobacter sp. PAMC 29334]
MTASFDTNILIDLLAGDRRARAELQSVERPWVSRISWIEVMSKVRPEEDRVMAAFFADFGIDEVDEPIARRAALLRLERSSLKLPDAIILASAQIHHRVLVTRNTKDFPANMPGIRVPYAV